MKGKKHRAVISDSIYILTKRDVLYMSAGKIAEVKDAAGNHSSISGISAAIPLLHIYWKILSIVPGKQRWRYVNSESLCLQKHWREWNILLVLIAEFHNSVDDYPPVCKEENREPEKSYKGSFNIRFKDPLLHKHAAIYAFRHNTSLNNVVEESVKMFI